MNVRAIQAALKTFCWWKHWPLFSVFEKCRFQTESGNLNDFLMTNRSGVWIINHLYHHVVLTDCERQDKIFVIAEISGSLCEYWMQMNRIVLPLYLVLCNQNSIVSCLLYLLFYLCISFFVFRTVLFFVFCFYCIASSATGTWRGNRISL